MINEQQPVGTPEQEQITVQPVESAQAVEVVSERTSGRFQNYWLRLKRFIGECKRVMKVIQRPSKEEFLTTAKVSAAGIAIIGLLGFILSMIQQLVI